MSSIPPIVDPEAHLERTSFQEAGPFSPSIDTRADVAMVYGIGEDTPERIRQWKEQGYRIHVMTGVAWGNYQDFLFGKWDGENHEDAGQKDRNGNVISHGPTVPYMCPTPTYGKYLCVGVKRAIDAGAEAIHLEEPEFWVRAGYEEAFKREWQDYYKEPWVAPHTSHDAQYRASKLKYYLYRRALTDVFTFVRDYGRQIGRDVKCYVPTHSMINYAWWGIVSPEWSLVMIDGCDGYIGQVWTGTARTPNVYKGVKRERTFETAICEYGALHNLVRSTGKRMWYLNDPIEDNPGFSWADYRYNWESTLVASLLWPDVWRYEIAPWPSRVFNGKYPAKNLRDLAPGEQVEREGIPADYATELVTVFNSLADMDQPDVSWEGGTRGIGVLVSDTLMFQRTDPDPSNVDFSSFFGLAMPLLKRGILAEPVQMENTGLQGYLKPYSVLFLTYEGMKPPSVELHSHIADWVRNGGVLVFVDDGGDPYNRVREWWNSGVNRYERPGDHLLELLEARSEGESRAGKGCVIYRKLSPASLASEGAGDALVADLAERACRLAGSKWQTTGSMTLRRGPYVIAAGLDETDEQHSSVYGSFVDLFSARLQVRDCVNLEPGTRVYLIDLERLKASAPCVVASASKVLEERASEGSFRFHSEGPDGVVCSTRLLLPTSPQSVTVDGRALAEDWDWDSRTHTCLLRYPNAAKGCWVQVDW